MKGTIYGSRLPRGTQVEKGWGPLVRAVRNLNLKLLSTLIVQILRDTTPCLRASGYRRCEESQTKIPRPSETSANSRPKDAASRPKKFES